jgi:hypothetical protein
MKLTATTSAEIRVDLGVYSLLTVQKAVASMAGSCAAEILQDTGRRLCVRLIARANTECASDLCAEFIASLLDITLQDKLPA